jgi:hypothetical protein
MQEKISIATAPAPAATEPFPGAPAMALTFLFAGLGYASPLFFFSDQHPLNGPISPEILNLNLLVAWMGLAHFVFAYSAQARTLARSTPRTRWIFLGSIALGAAFLAGTRAALGAWVFDLLVWIYFIPHFIKAELWFITHSRSELHVKPGALYWFPAVGFAFFSWALFGPISISFNTEILVLLAFLCVAAGMAGRILPQLSDPSVATYALLGFFFIGEGLVWGAYSKYMTPQFRHGLYVFHIAVASFYHYFRSYAFALRKKMAGEVERYWVSVFAVNLAVGALGAWIAFHPQWQWPQYVFGLPYFTFWVGLHLVSSDVFTALRPSRPLLRTSQL